MKGELLISILLLGFASAAIPRFTNGASVQVQDSARNVCVNKVGGIVADPEYCYKFIICVLYMEMTSVSCNPGEIYYGNTCREGNQDTCQLGPPAVTVPPTEGPTDPPPTTIAPPLSTNLKEICEGVFFAARPYMDCGMFAGCVRGTGTIFQCAEQEVFDPNLLICVEGDRHACTSTPTPTPTPSTKWPTTTESSLDNICQGIEYGSIEHPNNCALWIVCIQENFNIRQCPLGQIWRISEGECRNGNSITCEVFPELNPSTVTEPTEATTTAIPQPCDGITRGNVPHPTGNCVWYIQCSFERGTVRQCPANHIFSVDLKECVEGNQSTCTPI